MKRVASVVLLLMLGMGAVAVPTWAIDNAKVQAREARKAEKKREKIRKKFAKAQKKAQQKMLKNDRKNTHYPQHPF